MTVRENFGILSFLLSFRPMQLSAALSMDLFPIGIAKTMGHQLA
jgi:hypothetical protein